MSGLTSGSIRDRFRKRCRREHDWIDELTNRNEPLSSDEEAELILRVHSLAGAGGTFGYPEISERALRAEQVMRQTSCTSPESREAVEALLQALEAATQE
ncbi:HPt (histidine-containing phosphotransfer) domain-containing protein [Rhodopseudomonas julia]|uniref:HPt (Histidine-containing phosphotransfer) domain-containing protein n=1 Tax=Rhodopseudomonas julia TaxID=200617 RepID=A0ABU0C7Q0_9BRAD|nr:Hpt domain-containing protein [Rhodopseudomonas julia]MDQ0326524.1 HPt (histidine-containing phosphotransfer) domain-containing protein [Rhodopseudomonas julia]